ncbi:hypothetical protein TNCV_511501 [Trichonephila clavipes]|nr:hypothetical protein TNCV_511501 [Trichonephila clavipes]
MQVDVMGECLSSTKHVVGVRSVFLAKEIPRRIAVKNHTELLPQREMANNQSVRRHLEALPERSNHWEVGGRPQCDKCGCRVWNCSQHRFTTLETISNYRNSYPVVSVVVVPRGTTPANDHFVIVLQARRNRRQTAGERS